MGNPNLLNEETINYEIGASYSATAFQLTGSLFYKEGKNIVDWVRASTNDIWTVRNETSLNTAGIEAGLIIFPENIIDGFPVNALSISYTYLSLDRSTSSFESKYSLDHLKHQIILSASNNLIFGITQNWTMRYEKRENFEDHFIADSQISREFGYFSVTIKAANLFNKSYMDLGGIPLPGRWISANIKFRWE